MFVIVLVSACVPETNINSTSTCWMVAEEEVNRKRGAISCQGPAMGGKGVCTNTWPSCPQVSLSAAARRQSSPILRHHRTLNESFTKMIVVLREGEVQLEGARGAGGEHYTHTCYVCLGLGARQNKKRRVKQGKERGKGNEDE